MKQIKQINVRVDKELWAEVKIACTKNNLTFQELIPTLLRKWLAGEIELEDTEG